VLVFQLRHSDSTIEVRDSCIHYWVLLKRLFFYLHCITLNNKMILNDKVEMTKEKTVAKCFKIYISIWLDVLRKTSKNSNHKYALSLLIQSKSLSISAQGATRLICLWELPSPYLGSSNSWFSSVLPAKCRERERERESAHSGHHCFLPIPLHITSRLIWF
jgi:hypothetical protein